MQLLSLRWQSPKFVNLLLALLLLPSFSSAQNEQDFLQIEEYQRVWAYSSHSPQTISYLVIGRMMAAVDAIARSAEQPGEMFNQPFVEFAEIALESEELIHEENRELYETQLNRVLMALGFDLRGEHKGLAQQLLQLFPGTSQRLIGYVDRHEFWGEFPPLEEPVPRADRRGLVLPEILNQRTTGFPQLVYSVLSPLITVVTEEEFSLSTRARVLIERGEGLAPGVTRQGLLDALRVVLLDYGFDEWAEDTSLLVRLTVYFPATIDRVLLLHEGAGAERSGELSPCGIVLYGMDSY